MSTCDLKTSWNAEAALVQSLMFSILLITVAITFQHLAHSGYELSKPLAIIMATSLAVIALSFGAIGVFAYSKRSSPGTGCSHESFIRTCIIIFGCSLLVIELIFAIAALIIILQRKKTIP